MIPKGKLKFPANRTLFCVHKNEMMSRLPPENIVNVSSTVLFPLFASHQSVKCAIFTLHFFGILNGIVLEKDIYLQQEAKKWRHSQKVYFFIFNKTRVSQNSFIITVYTCAHMYLIQVKNDLLFCLITFYFNNGINSSWHAIDYILQ